MDISTIYAWNPDQLLSNYAPVYALVVSDSLVTPVQPMYADIYFNTVFYKTITSYSINNLLGYSYFEFDFQDACQEYLKVKVPAPALLTIQQSNTGQYSEVNMVVKFRGSTYVGGLLVPNGPVPVQATATTPAIPGGGWPTDNAHILNSSLIPFYQRNNDLPGLMSFFRRTDGVFGTLLAGTEVYPLSNQPALTGMIPSFGLLYPNANAATVVYGGDCGLFPFVVQSFGPSGILSPLFRNVQVYVEFLVNGITPIAGSPFLLTTPVLLGPGTYYLPTGLKEILAIIASGTVTAAVLNPSNNMYYQVILYDADAAKPAFYTPWFKVGYRAIEEKRVWFQNMYGHFEQLSFNRTVEETGTNSSEQYKTYPEVGENYTDAGRQRYNVRMSETYTLTGVFPEIQMEWIKELLGSPWCFVEGVIGTPYTPPSDLGHVRLRPYKVVDGSFKTRKTISDSRFTYEVSIKIQPSIDWITLRN